MIRALRQWLRVKRVCAWCEPHRWLGGNPFATRVTHTICDRCARTKFTLTGTDPEFSEPQEVVSTISTSNQEDKTHE